MTDPSYEELAKKVHVLEKLREAAERMLCESEQKYKELVEKSPVGIYEVDYRTGKFVLVNDVMIKLLGYTSEEFYQMGSIDMLSPESKQAFMKRLEMISQGIEPPSVQEFEVIAKDGTRYWTELHVSYKKESDQIIGANVVAIDIGERKRAQAEKEALEHSLWDLFNYSKWLVVVLDSHRKVKNCSIFFLQTLEYENKEEVTGKSFCTFLPSGQEALVKTIIEHPEQEWIGELVTKTRKRISTKWFSSPVNGNWIFLVGIPLLSEMKVAENIEGVRSLWRDRILQDRTMIQALKHTAETPIERRMS